MRKIIGLLFLVILTCCLFACGIPEDYDENSGTANNNTQLDGSDNTVSGNTQLDENTFANLKVNPAKLTDESIGLVKEIDSTEEENYYVATFDANGNYEKLTFYKDTETVYDDGSVELTQESLDAYVHQIYNTEDFIYMGFKEEPLSYFYEGDFNNSYFSPYSYFKVFVIAKASGKIYSLNDYTVVLVTSNKTARLNDSYYKIEIVDDNLELHNILSNSNIEVLEIKQDKEENIFIYNNSVDSVDGDVIYSTTEISIGNDGYAYTFAMYSGNKSFDGFYAFKIYKFNSSGVKSEISTFTSTVMVEFNDSILYLSNSYVLVLDFSLYYHEYEGNYSDGESYFTRQDMEAYILPSDVWTQLNAMFNSKVVTEENFLFLQEYNDDNIYYFDLESFDTSSSRFTNGGIVDKQGDIGIISTSKYLERLGVATVTVEGVSGTSEYKMVVNGNSVTTELISQIDYDNSVLIIMPLN